MNGHDHQSTHSSIFLTETNCIKRNRVPNTHTHTHTNSLPSTLAALIFCMTALVQIRCPLINFHFELSLYSGCIVSEIFRKAWYFPENLERVCFPNLMPVYISLKGQNNLVNTFTKWLPKSLYFLRAEVTKTHTFCIINMCNQWRSFEKSRTMFLSKWSEGITSQGPCFEKHVSSVATPPFVLLDWSSSTRDITFVISLIVCYKSDVQELRETIWTFQHARNADAHLLSR